MLTPEKIAAMDAITGFKTPTTSPSANAIRTRADEIRALGVSSQPASKPTDSRVFVQDVVKEDLGMRRKGIDETEKAYSEGKINLPQAALNNAGQVVGGAFDILMSPIKALIREQSQVKENTPRKEEKLPLLQEKLSSALAAPGISTYENAGKLAQTAGDLYQKAHTETDPAKKQKLLELADENSKTAALIRAKADEIDTSLRENAKTASATLDIGGLALGGGAGKAVEEGAVAAKTLAEKTASTVSSTVSKQAEKTALQSGVKAFDEALEVVRPVLTPTEKELAMKEGRVITEGILRKTKVKPDVYEQRIADSISSLVEEGRVAKSALPEKNIEEISREVSRINSDVKNFIADHKAPFNESQLRTKLNAVRDENKIIFASDPTVEKTFDAVVNEFISHVKNMDTAGLFEARQSFDKIPVIKKLLENEKLGENVKRQIVLDVRRAANNYVADLLPENSPYKAMLERETYMLRAIENIAGSAKGRIDTNFIQRMFKEHPWLKTAVGFGVGAGGVQFLSN